MGERRPKRSSRSGRQRSHDLLARRNGCALGRPFFRPLRGSLGLGPLCHRGRRRHHQSERDRRHLYDLAVPGRAIRRIVAEGAVRSAMGRRFSGPVRDNPFRTRRWFYPYDALIERGFFRWADHLAANTDTVAAAWRARYPQWREKISVLWNSYDPLEPIATGETARRPERVLAHIGSLY